MIPLNQAQELFVLITDYADAYKTGNTRLIQYTGANLEKTINSLIDPDTIINNTDKLSSLTP